MANKINIQRAVDYLPTAKVITKILEAKKAYTENEKKLSPKDFNLWTKSNFTKTPWGMAWMVCPKGKQPNEYKALAYLLVAIIIDWKELVEQLKKTVKNWGYTKADIEFLQEKIWEPCVGSIVSIINSTKIKESLNKITEDIEKHPALNSKLFNDKGELRARVRNKMLEIVDHFISDLKEQNIKMKINDILFVGSNASYNYTKNSDIDLHIITDTKSLDCPENISEALYSAYRTLFNKTFDISICNIPLELYIEIESSPRKSNGVYSVKKDKWIKEPVPKDIPDYDKEALAELVNKWESRCKKLIADVKADKLENEDKILKLIEDIYEKLRKKGMAISEYSLENLAFKELRNKGYLDKLKEYRDELISKRLSLEEQITNDNRPNISTEISSIAGVTPVIQDNGIFFIYNLKADTINTIVNKLKQLPYVKAVTANEAESYDFSNINQLALRQIPKRYYNIRGEINI